MSYCNCGFDTGDPRVTEHTATCASLYIKELERRLKEIHDIAFWSGSHDDVMKANLEEIAKLTEIKK